MNRPTLEGYCKHCKMDSEFRYVSSTAGTKALPATDYYSCSCGETYPVRDLLSLENARRLHAWSVTPK